MLRVVFFVVVLVFSCFGTCSLEIRMKDFFCETFFDIPKDILFGWVKELLKGFAVLLGNFCALHDIENNSIWSLRLKKIFLRKTWYFTFLDCQRVP